MSWTVALIDSCGRWAGAVAAAAFVSDGEVVSMIPAGGDPTGHGSAIAALLTAPGCNVQLMLGQVFLRPGAATPAAVAAAIDWSVERRAQLVHLSLGLSADRSVLRRAVDRALAAGCIVVASSPARGSAVYPAAYPDVIRATGDARCAPGQWATLDLGLFGGCVHSLNPQNGVAGHGASIGAAWISRAILNLPVGASSAAVMEALVAGATYHGRERHGAAPKEFG